jgi:HEXXH motif-containing protein
MRGSSMACSTLAREDFLRLAGGEITFGIVKNLRHYQLIKNELLLEALRRTVHACAGQDEAAVIDAATGTLGEVQATHPSVAAKFMTLPQFGSWAAECLFRLRGLLSAPQIDALPPLSIHLGRAATFAAAAAIEAGHPFDLTVPLHAGGFSLPGLGMMYLEARGWGRCWRNGDGALVAAGSRTAAVPAGRADPAHEGGKGWVPVPRITAQAHGLAIDVGIEILDPVVQRFGSISHFGQDEHGLWQERLAEAWQILVSNDRQAAEAIASVLTTIVPLREPRKGYPTSATSGWAWGAAALSLPPDPLSLAETIVHEFHHLILGALDDIIALMAKVDRRLYYAPWRDDARPLPGLLQGCYAHLGVTGFWLRQRRLSSGRARQRSDVEFARRSQGAFEAAETLAASGALSEAGQAFAARMRDRLAEWRREPVCDLARLDASEIAAEHRIRWRLAHVRPSPAIIDRLARARLGGSPTPPNVARTPTAAVRPHCPLPSIRFRLLELRYRDEARFRRLIEAETTLDEADTALLRGDDAAAETLYRRRIEAREDLDAWAGLILVRHRNVSAGTGRLLRERPEFAVALYRRLNTLSDTAHDPAALVAWLSEDPASTR